MKFLGSAAVASASFIVVIVGCLVSQPVDSQPAPTQEQLVDAAGNMRIPNNYRTTYEFLGSWSVAGDKGAKQIHLVYASPGSAAAYRATGKFPDGSILGGSLRHGHFGYDDRDGQPSRHSQRLVHDGEGQCEQPPR